jgi:hypothetical protein
MFERLVNPVCVTLVDHRTLDRFVAKRLAMRGKKKKEIISPETVRKNLRVVRAALNQATRWKYSDTVPERRDGLGR